MGIFDEIAQARNQQATTIKRIAAEKAAKIAEFRVNIEDTLKKVHEYFQEQRDQAKALGIESDAQVVEDSDTGEIRVEFAFTDPNDRYPRHSYEIDVRFVPNTPVSLTTHIERGPETHDTLFKDLDSDLGDVEYPHLVQNLDHIFRQIITRLYR